MSSSYMPTKKKPIILTYEKLHLFLDLRMKEDSRSVVVLGLVKNAEYRSSIQFRRGHTLRIGITNSHICAVRSMMNYLHMRGGKSGLLFILENGLPLTRRG